MKALKLIATAGVLSAGLLPTLAAHAADTVVFGAAGLPVLFNNFARASYTASGASNNYTAKNAAMIHDTSTAGIPDQIGDLFIIWNGAPVGSRKIWFYISVESMVGVRSYFNSAKLTFTTLPTAQNLVSGLAPDQTVPADVQTAIKNSIINVALTDITAADAEQATMDSTSAGYSLTNPIKGDGGQVAAVPFSLSTRTYRQEDIAALPVIVFVNKTKTTAGHLGASTVTNIDRFALAGFLNGTFRRTSDIDTSIAPGGGPVVTFLREPLSGSYLTVEKCIPASLECATTQEHGISSTLNNPANTTTPAWTATSPTVTNGGRVRVIGETQMISDVNITPDSLGYAFWNPYTFLPGPNNATKYLTVDGVDPLLDAYGTGSAAGVYPAVSAVTFRNIINGGYSIWSKIRLLEPSPGSVDIATTLKDFLSFIPVNSEYIENRSLKVFRSHYATGGVTTLHNENFGSGGQSGGDAGGAIFPVVADLDYNMDTGLELLGSKQ